MKALISVSDKTGIVEFAKRLQAQGIEIVSTGGTYQKLKEEGYGACRGECSRQHTSV